MDIPSIDSISSLLGSVLDSNQDLVINELGNNFRVLFNHSEFLNTECKYFIREFETKRSSEDLQATKALVYQQTKSQRIFDSFSHINEDIDSINIALKELQTSITTVLDKEEEQTKKDVKTIARITEQKELDQVQYSKDMTALQVEIDAKWNDSVEELKKSYKIPEEIKKRMEERRKQREELGQGWFTKRL